MTQLKTTNIKGKQYVEVHERLRHFREADEYKGFSLETELIAVNPDTALMRAVIRDAEGRVLATGTAFERKDNAASMVNKTSHVENCETSAWGRALGNLGIGIEASVASANEVRNAQANEKPAPKAPPKAVLATQEQLALIDQLCKQTGTELSKLKKAFQIKTDIPTVAAANAMIDGLKKKLEVQNKAPVLPSVEQAAEGMAQAGRMLSDMRGPVGNATHEAAPPSAA